MKTPAFDLAGHLAHVCAPQLQAITSHPWIRAAAHDQLRPEQIGSWATQDLLWGDWIGPAYSLGLANPTPGAAEFLAYLESDNTTETDYLEDTSQHYQNAANASIIWPGYLGYGAWGALTAQNEDDATLKAGVPHLQALTVVWCAEYAYNQAWKVVLAGRPKQAAIAFGGPHWGGLVFTSQVETLSAGLNQAYALDSSVPLATLETIARQDFMWESRAWTDVYECIGWDAPPMSGRGDQQ